MYKADKNLIVCKILLIDGILLILLSFVQIFGSPFIRQWLGGTLSPETVTQISLVRSLHHMLIGILMIPFGIGTIFTAAGVRAGQRWTRGIAYTNALAIIIIPFGGVFVMGSYGSEDLLSTVATSITTIVGISMFLSLLWMKNP